MPEGLMSHKEFYDAVGASYRQIRQAMEDLGLEPLRTNISDLRKTQYRPEWVDQVIRRILENAARKS